MRPFLHSVPEGADLGRGCGNPQAIAALKPGERVLDLGSSAGIDAFLAARQVGLSGRVERLHAWVYRTARNVMVEHYRSSAGHREVASGLSGRTRSARHDRQL